MNTLSAYSPSIGATAPLPDIAGARHGQPALHRFGAGDASHLGPLHVGSDSQPRSIDAIEQDFVRALLEPLVR